MKWLCVPQPHCETSLNVTPVVGTHSLFRAFLIRKSSEGERADSVSMQLSLSHHGKDSDFLMVWIKE